MWELDGVPEHYKAEALVIIEARKGAAPYIARDTGAQPFFDVTKLFDM